MINIYDKTMCEACFAPTDQDPCPKCGFSKSTYQHDNTVLGIGSLLEGRYLIGKSIGKGGFGITYLAYDVKMRCKVAIKEYYPYGIAVRDSDTKTVNVTSGESKSTFEEGASKFYEEARLVAGFNGNPNIVSVYDFFYGNDTVYFTMGYLEGVTLKAYIQKNGLLSVNKAVRVAYDICNALMVAHSQNVLHRDISPDNIMICYDGTIKLLDFGAARQVISDESRSLSVILKQGFAPLEQYQRKGKQGPWTDIYSLGATLFYSMTGAILEDPMSRLDDDDEYLSNPHNIREDLWQIIKKATMLKKNDRYQNVFELKEALDSAGISPEPLIVVDYKAKFGMNNSAPSTPVVTPAPMDVTTPVKQQVTPAPMDVTMPVKQQVTPAPMDVTMPMKQQATPAPMDVTMPMKQQATPAPMDVTMPMKQQATPAPMDVTMPVKQQATPAPMDVTMPMKQQATPAPMDVTMPMKQQATPTIQDEPLTEENERPDSNWNCSFCGALNSKTREKCYKCGEIYVRRPPDTKSLNPWICSQCGASNSKYSTACIECNALKKGSASAQQSVTPAPQAISESESDTKPKQNWVCSYCGTLNFKTEYKCCKCQRKKYNNNSEWESVDVTLFKSFDDDESKDILPDESAIEAYDRKMKKKRKTIIAIATPIAAVLLAMLIGVLIWTNQEYHYRTENGGIVITSYNGNATEVVIPSMIKGTPVIGIDDEAFSYCASLEKITIPDGIETIGNAAFSYCGLKTVHLPDSITTIGNSAFQSCGSLTTINIPNGVTSIGFSAFAYCENLKEITIPNSVTSIKNRAFKDCVSLVSVTIPNSVTDIGYGAFSNCSLTSVSVPNGCNIDSEAFDSNVWITYRKAGQQTTQTPSVPSAPSTQATTSKPAEPSNPSQPDRPDQNEPPRPPQQ